MAKKDGTSSSHSLPLTDITGDDAQSTLTLSPLLQDHVTWDDEYGSFRKSFILSCLLSIPVTPYLH